MKTNLFYIIILFSLINFGYGQVISYNQQIQSLADSVSIENIEQKISVLCWANGYQSRVTFTPGNYYAAEYIAQYFESLPGISTVIRDTFKLAVANYPYNEYPLINVIATLDGTHPDSGIILLGGHYDASASHESNWNTNWNILKAQGADDNATGVASLMEVARILSNPAINFNNTKTIKFIAFAAEEYNPEHSNYHHVGSLYDAQKTYQNNDKLDAALILDMIGYNPLKDYVEVISNNGSLWLTDYIYDSRDLYIPTLQTNSYPANVPYSDHDSYQQYGYSAILLMENDRPWNNDLPHYQSNPFYHSIGDSIETLNLNLIEKVAKTTIATIAHLSKPEITGIETSNENILVSKFTLNVFPNPFNSSTSLSFNLKEDTYLTIDVYNLAGEKVANLSKYSLFQRGSNQIRWDANSIATGIYFVNIQGDLINANHKLILIK